MTAIVTRTRVVAHTIRAHHATTGAPVPVRAAFATEVPRGWRLKVRDGLVVVSRDAEDRAPDGTVVVSIAADDRALLLAQPEADVPLDAAEKVHAFEPVPTAVEVVLVRASNGAPSTGRTVTVKPRTGTAVTLAETPAASGVYRATRAWSAAFHPLEIRVGNTTARRVSYDPTSHVQRIRLVDPT